MQKTFLSILQKIRSFKTRVSRHLDRSGFLYEELDPIDDKDYQRFLSKLYGGFPKNNVLLTELIKRRAELALNLSKDQEYLVRLEQLLVLEWERIHVNNV